MNFSEFYLQEGKTDIKAPVKIEKVFVDVINTGRAKPDRKRYEDVVKTIVDHLGLEGQASHVGSDMNGKLNPFYTKAIERLEMPSRDINRRPKTDIIVNDVRISMKLDRGWIFSHQLNDTQACLEYVIDQSKLKDDLALEVLTVFEELKNKQSKDLYTMSKGKVLKIKLVEAFKRLLAEQDNYLKKEFIRAGLRGTFKFEESDKAVADEMLVVKFKNKNLNAQTAMADIKLIKLDQTHIYDLKVDHPYINSLAEKSRLAFVIRKSGKLRFDINSVDLDGEVLAEGIIDTIGDLLKQGYEKVKAQVEKLFKYLIDLIQKGIKYFMDLLGISLEVEMNNEIEF